MSYKKFSSKDLIYNVLDTKPKYVFSVKEGKTYLQYSSASYGNFEDENGNPNTLRHIPSGHISLHEININRPSDSLVYNYLIRNSNNEALPPVSSSTDLNEIPLGQMMTTNYPMSASINRIFVPAGVEINGDLDENQNPQNAHENRKYVRALRNVVEIQENVSSGIGFGTMGTDTVNMICIPGIFYGSKINPGSIKLEYFVNNNKIGVVQDKFKDGRLLQVPDTESGVYEQVGTVVYNQGLLLLTSSAPIVDNHQENYESADAAATTSPKWTNFGTGLEQVGLPLSHGSCQNSSYQIFFEGINKIPTLTMYAYSNLGDDNYSHNPTFLTSSRSETIRHSSSSFYQQEVDIKKINKSLYTDAEEEFENVTYISKIGIYDKYKNLIAIASLSRPVKKTEKRDYMFKIGIDF